jgi:hypothetical protein
MMDDADLERYQALYQICHVKRFGVVEGVEFDFRHEDLDPTQWGMQLIGMTIGAPTKSSREPFIWFPWYGKFDKTQIASNFETEYAKQGTSFAKSTLLRHLKYHTPDAFIFEGDKIFVSDVFKVIAERPFAHPHDAEKRVAFFAIRRRNGRTIYLKTPIEFIGHTSVLFRPTSLDFMNNIATRMVEYFDIASIDDPKADDIVDGSDTYAAGALFWLKLLLRFRGPDLALIDELDFKDPRHHAAFAIKQTIEQSMRIGYFWAYAEAEQRMEPFAKAGLNAQKIAQKAGVVSGNKRRAKANATWKPHAMELARQLRHANPSLSQHRLADEIAFAWKLEAAPPGHSTLTTFIAESEKSGALPRRDVD